MATFMNSVSVIRTFTAHVIHVMNSVSVTFTGHVIHVMDSVSVMRTFTGHVTQATDSDKQNNNNNNNNNKQKTKASVYFETSNCGLFKTPSDTKRLKTRWQ